jgi:hypothetical protein
VRFADQPFQRHIQAPSYVILPSSRLSPLQHCLQALSEFNFPSKSSSLTQALTWPPHTHPSVTHSHYVFILLISRSRDNAVGTAAGYGLDDGGVGVRGSVGSRIFSSARRPDRFWGPPSLLSNGYGAPSPGVERPGREADHSPPTSAEIKEMWSINPLPHTPSWCDCLIS